MKWVKVFYVFFVFGLAVAMVTGCSTLQTAKPVPTVQQKTADDWQPAIKTQMDQEAPAPKSIEDFNTSAGQSLKISFVRTEDNGQTLVWQLSGIRLVPKNKPEVASVAAVRVKLSSDLHEFYFGKSNVYVYDITVPADGVIKLRTKNYAIASGQPMVEKHHGIGYDAAGNALFLMLDPQDPWVTYEEVGSGYEVKADNTFCDLNTLSWAYVMYPDGSPPQPLKAVLKAKGMKYNVGLPANAHPELAK